MKLRLRILICLGFFCSNQSAVAQTAVDEFQRGNAYYRESQFERAIDAYEKIFGQGVTSPALYFNLGNAYYRTGKNARAILAYERALHLEPNDPDIKHNLDLANLKTVDRIEPLPELFFIEWLRNLSAFVPPGTTALLFAVCWILLFGALTVLNLLTQPTLPLRALRGVAMGSFLLFIPLGVLLVTQAIESRSHNDAIVTAAVVTAKTSPDTQSVDAFVVHEGLKVKLSDSVGEWVKITLADGKVGWVRAQDCERI